MAPGLLCLLIPPPNGLQRFSTIIADKPATLGITRVCVRTLFSLSCQCLTLFVELRSKATAQTGVTFLRWIVGTRQWHNRAFPREWEGFPKTMENTKKSLLSLLYVSRLEYEIAVFPRLSNIQIRTKRPLFYVTFINYITLSVNVCQGKSRILERRDTGRGRGPDPKSVPSGARHCCTLVEYDARAPRQRDRTLRLRKTRGDFFTETHGSGRPRSDFSNTNEIRARNALRISSR